MKYATRTFHSQKRKLTNMKCDRNRIIQNQNKKPIVYDVYFTPDGRPKPIVIFCHGYKGFKDWGAWHLVAKEFAKAGYFFVKFNFSHNGGTPEEPIDFPDLEAFAQNNYTKELDDLGQVIDYFGADNEYIQEIDTSAISLIGHSRGGGIVLIKAQEDLRISQVITWAGVSDFKVRFNEGSAEFLNWKKEGRTFVKNGRTNQMMPHDWQFYNNFISNEKRLTIRRAVQSLTQPCLIVHGDKDETVTIAEAKQLNDWNNSTTLKIITEGDHVFGSSHPWSHGHLPAQLKQVVDVTIGFIGG